MSANKPAVPRVRILAYIDHIPAATDMNFLAICARAGLKRSPALNAGFLCDVTVELHSGTQYAIIDHYGDGALYPTFEAARDKIREETGVEVEPIAEETPRPEEPLRRVGCYVREFVPTKKSRKGIEAESPMSIRNHSARFGPSKEQRPQRLK